MFDYIRKGEYFEWIDAFSSVRSTYASASVNNLKDIQDHYVLNRLKDTRDIRILEVGGGVCRTLRTFADRNECWNAEMFEGLGAGPKKVIETPDVRNVLTYVGDFSPELPEAYFDVVFSVSVVEHVETDLLRDFFRDIARVLRPGGRTFHAIDVYLFDPDRFSDSQAIYTHRRLAAYLDVSEMTEGALQFVEPPRASAEPRFSCEYASNSDREMLAWNKVVPQLAPIRAVGQSCSLKCEWTRSSLASGPVVRFP